jgi:5-methyltetrahydropteroyltriglutamate--homocysteine methyltransferase
MTLKTTTIGSLYRFRDDLHGSIEEAIAFQESLGLDLISDGEQRTDMVSYFAESLTGLAVESGMPVITGKVELKSDPVEFSKVKDLRFIREKHPDVPLKVAITGPTTLGMTCGSRKIGSHYKGLSDFSLYEDIASALAPIAAEIAALGGHVQIDEPFLSQGYKDLKERVALLDGIAAGVPPERASIHVCGNITRFGVFDWLMNLDNVSTLSFAFAGKQERPNIELLKSGTIAGSDKRLGVGCIAVTPMSEAEVDPPEAVRDMLQNVVDRIGLDSIAYAHPDCGLRATGKSLVPIILRNLRAGVSLLG